MRGLSRLAPEEIAGAVLLILALAVVALRPGSVTQLFESPYASPAPSRGPARLLVPDPTVAPASRVIPVAPIGNVRDIRIGTTDGRTIVYLPDAFPGSMRCPEIKWTATASSAGLALVCVPITSAPPAAP